MADGKSLTEKTMVVVFSRVLTSLIDLTTMIMVARMLEKAEVGIIMFLLGIYGVARNIATLGFPESIFYYFEHLSKNFRKAFALQTSGILFVTALIAAGIILIVQGFAPQILSNFSPEAVETIQKYLPFIAIIAVLEIPSWPVHNVLLASDRQKEAGWYQIITSIMSFSALVIPLALGLPIGALLYSMMGYAGLRLLGSMVWMLLILPPGERRTPEGNLFEQIKFSIPLGLSSMVNILNKYADKFIVAILLTETALAEYSVAAEEVPIIRVIPFAVGTVLISRYVNLQIKGEKEKLLDIWYKGINKVSLIVIPLTILSVVLAPYFIEIYETGDTDYIKAILPFQIYNIIILLRVAHYGSILQAFGDTKGILRLSISLVVINIVLSTPLTMVYGIKGTALGTLLANIINWVFLLRRIGSHLEIPVRKVLPFGYYGKVLLLSLVAGASVYFISPLIAPHFHWIGTVILCASVYLLIYASVGSFFRILTPEDWRNAKEMLTLKFLWK